MINVNGLKRNAKNIVKKYTEPQIKVREATSNDPWGPSSTIMAEIADLTYNVVAFSEIMQMIWRRLNDHGKNWRHVYKALVVLEYLIKTGTEKVAQQCVENIFAIETLKDFQYMEDNKDLGMNIREKSKKLVALLKDTEKLKAERGRAIKAKTRLAESMSSVGKSSFSIGYMMGTGRSDSSTNNNNNNSDNSNFMNYHNDSGGSSSTNAASSSHLPDIGSLAILNSDLDSARPQTASEEENQLKLALALSKEEADQQEKIRKNDELRLKLALDVSKKTVSSSLIDDITSKPSISEASKIASTSSMPASTSSSATKSRSTIDDLLGLTIPPPEPQNDPWSANSWQTVANPTLPQQPASSTIATTSNLNPQTMLQTTPQQTLSSTLATNLNTPATSSLANFNPIMPLTQLATQSITTNSSIVPTPVMGANNNNVLNKKPMSKNPFEDF